MPGEGGIRWRVFEPSTVEQLAASFALRPGMYVGDCVAPDQLVELFVEDVLSAGVTEVGVELDERGAISLRVTSRERLSDWSREWEAALADPRSTRVVHTLALQLLRLASTELEARWSGHEMLVAFRPDPARFREPFAVHASLGFFADLATAHPGLRVFVRDRAAGLDATLTYPRGAMDRVLAEGARSRLNHRPLRIEGTVAEVRMDLALAWHQGPGLQLVALVNGERSRNGGTHVLGFWEGVAASIETRLPPGRDRPRRRLTEREVPRNAVLVISVHLDNPEYGPATRDCLHDVRAREAIRTRVEEAFGQWLDQEADRGDPPWQLLGGLHDGEPWMKTCAEMLSRPAGPPVPDAYLHRDDE